MSQKIKSKDLSYDQNLPPFLQRLKAQNAGYGDRHEREIARPRKAHVADQEDEPTIVDESGELITQSELDQRAATEAADEKATKPSSDMTKQTQSKLVDASAAARKRKIAKVIGEDNIPDDNEVHAPLAKKADKKVAKKKSKPIKLAFDQDDGS